MNGPRIIDGALNDGAGEIGKSGGIIDRGEPILVRLTLEAVFKKLVNLF